MNMADTAPGAGTPGDAQIQAFGAQLAELREEVSALSQALADGRDTHRAELRSISTQQADVDLQVRRETLRLEQLKLAIASKQALVEEESARSEALIAPLNDGMDRLETLIAEGIPYRTQDRLDAVDTLRTQLDAKTLNPQEATSRLWQALEDELRLTRENILDRQVIELRGEDQLVEVARLGMVALYYRTEEGEVGRALTTGSGYSFIPYDTPEESAQVMALFDALKKQIRTGFFTLPNPLPEAK